MRKPINNGFKLEVEIPSGIECPGCHSVANNKVIDSRTRPDGRMYRRRECLECSERWTTIEVIAPEDREVIVK